MSEQTVRGMVKEIQREVRDTPDLLPDRASVLQNKLSALLGNILDEQREADAAYAEVLLKLLESEEAANRAKIRAETTPEYRRKREARDTEKLAMELVRSLKAFVRSKHEEMKFQ